MLNAKTVSNGGGKTVDPLEIGTYPIRLAQVIDLGVQPRKPYKGEEKDPIQMLWVTYEVTTEFMKDEDGNDDTERPRWISESFPFYNLSADRAKSTARYLALDPQQACEGNWDQLVGSAGALTVVHNQSGDRTYANVGSVSPIMKGMAVEELKNPSVVFSLDEPDLDVFESLPDFLQEKIKGNVNFEGSKLATLLSGETVAETEENPFG